MIYRLEIFFTIWIVTFPVATEFATPTTFPRAGQLSVTFLTVIPLFVELEMGTEVVMRCKGSAIARFMFAGRGMSSAHMSLKSGPSAKIDGVTTCCGKAVWVRARIALV